VKLWIAHAVSLLYTVLAAACKLLHSVLPYPRFSFALTVVSLGCLSIGFSQVAPSSGTVHTADVDLAYEVYGQPTAEIPVFAVNGGPGLSHKYMMQNNVWQKLAEKRQIVFYDQRGTGKSTRIQAGASQAIDAQVADMEAVRAHFGFQIIDIVGDSYGGFLAMPTQRRILSASAN
jgi:hypothetical protein